MAFTRVVAQAKRGLQAKMPKKLPTETDTHGIFHLKRGKPKINSEKPSFSAPTHEKFYCPN